MTDEDDVKVLEEVQKKALEGKAQITLTRQEYDPEIKAWRMLLNWYEMYYTAPDLGAGNVSIPNG